MEYIIKNPKNGIFVLKIRGYIYKTSYNIEELKMIRNIFFSLYDYKDTKYVTKYDYGFKVLIKKEKKIFRAYDPTNHFRMKFAYIKARNYADTNPEIFDLNKVSY